MVKTSAGKNGDSGAARLFADFRLPAFDAEAIAAVQRKNLEAFAQANQLAVEGMRALTQRQTEILQQAIEQASVLWRDLLQPSLGENRLVKQTDAAQQVFERGVANARELRELSVKAGSDVFGVLARRVSESFDDVRLLAKQQAAG
jgi:phasin family protein